MSTKAAVTTKARERARAQLAERSAAARVREKANEDDLAAIFALDADLDAAATERDTAIAAATAAHDAAVAVTTAAQQDKVRALHARGESVTDIVAFTGWAAAQVRTALKAQSAASAGGGSGGSS